MYSLEYNEASFAKYLCNITHKADDRYVDKMGASCVLERLLVVVRKPSKFLLALETSVTN